MAFLSVASRDDLAPMQDFVDRHDLDGLFPHIADVSGEVWSRFGVSGQPTWAFVDDSGEARVHYGPLTPEALEQVVNDLASN